MRISMIFIGVIFYLNSAIANTSTIIDSYCPGPVTIARGNNVLCRILAGPEDRIAATSLQNHLLKKFNIPIDIVEPSDLGHSRYACEIVLGSAQTNAYLAKIAAEHKIDINLTELTTDGYVLHTLRNAGRDIVFAAGGGKPGVFYAVGELKNYYIRAEGENVVVLPAKVKEVPKFKYRWLWTWDNRMEWGGEPGGRGLGDANKIYQKRPESFLADYKACIDFMSENGFNGLVIWGFIRDSHGGVAASQKIARYAKQRGVRVMPGVGTSGYGGYVYEGDHLYNAHLWVTNHPELKAVGEHRHADGPCGSKAVNQQWLVDGAKWMFENFELDGINLEMGDKLVCECQDCKKARQAIDSDESDFYKDMAICQGPLVEAIRKLAPDAWICYATYTGFTNEMVTESPTFVDTIPSDAICLWTLTNMLRNDTWPAQARPPAAHNIGYVHWASKSNNDENEFYLERIRDVAGRSARSQLEGFAIYGELSDSRPNMRLNYLALREYSFCPNMSREEFTKKRLARLYGDELTEELWKVIELIGRNNARKADAKSNQALAIAKSALACAPDYARENWRDLIEHLESFR